jgi:hypothetical protein
LEAATWAGEVASLAKRQHMLFAFPAQPVPHEPGGRLRENHRAMRPRVIRVGVTHENQFLALCPAGVEPQAELRQAQSGGGHLHFKGGHAAKLESGPGASNLPWNW